MSYEIFGNEPAAIVVAKNGVSRTFIGFLRMHPWMGKSWAIVLSPSHKLRSARKLSWMREWPREGVDDEAWWRVRYIRIDDILEITVLTPEDYEAAAELAP